MLALLLLGASLPTDEQPAGKKLRSRPAATVF